MAGQLVDDRGGPHDGGYGDGYGEGSVPAAVVAEANHGPCRDEYSDRGDREDKADVALHYEAAHARRDRQEPVVIAQDRPRRHEEEGEGEDGDRRVPDALEGGRTQDAEVEQQDDGRPPRRRPAGSSMDDGDDAGDAQQVDESRGRDQAARGVPGDLVWQPEQVVKRRAGVEPAAPGVGTDQYGMMADVAHVHLDQGVVAVGGVGRAQASH